MGQPIADNIIKAGFHLIFSSTTSKTVDYFKRKAIVASSPVDVIEQAEIILFVLPTDKEIKEIVSAAKNKLSQKTLINLSTIAPKSAIKLQKLVKKFGGEYLECPMSGSRKPALDGTLLLYSHPNIKKFWTRITVRKHLFDSFTRTRAWFVTWLKNMGFQSLCFPNIKNFWKKVSKVDWATLTLFRS